MKTIDNKIIYKVLDVLREVYQTIKPAMVTDLVENYGINPFKVLISTVLSLRTKDEVSLKASLRLFKQFDSPELLALANAEQVRTLIYPVGFYKTKAEKIINISKILVEKYSSKVPDDIDTLLLFNGVGRKTANLVLAKGYGIPAVCVDTHVHRILNRWGYVTTKTPEQTEQEIRKKLHKENWIELNDILVAYGQNICRPVSPMCSKCRIESYCPKIGLKYSR